MSAVVSDIVPDLYLASQSPRRRELLRQIGVRHAVISASIPEQPAVGEAALDYVQRLAREKAAAVAGTGELVIAADTTVDLNGELLGKPVDEDDALPFGNPDRVGHQLEHRLEPLAHRLQR